MKQNMNKDTKNKIQVIKKNNLGQFICEQCRTKHNSENQYKLHLISPKHKQQTYQKPAQRKNEIQYELEETNSVIKLEILSIGDFFFKQLEGVVVFTGIGYKGIGIKYADNIRVKRVKTKTFLIEKVTQ
eukprot:EST41908.1 Zinc-finger of C2H2 type-containing protein [Spironucleus salmonicida]